MAALAGFFLGTNHSVLEYPTIAGAGLGALLFAGIAAECFARYRFNGKKWLVAITIASTILAVGFCVLYFALVNR